MPSDPTQENAPSAALAAVEHRVEDALHDAQRSLARRFGAGVAGLIGFAFRTLLTWFLIVYFAFGALWLTTRYYLLPHIDEFRPAIEREAGKMLDTRVSIGRIETGWVGLNPHLRMTDVRIFDRGGQAALTLPLTEATLAWSSVPTMTLALRNLSVKDPELDIRRLADGRFEIAGFAFDPKAPGDGRLVDWVLSQRHISIRDARVTYRDAAVDAEPLLFDDVDVEFRRGLIRDRFAFRARPPAAMGDVLDVRGEYQRLWFQRTKEASQWTGRAYAQTDFVDLARVAPYLHALPADARIERARGALRAWIDFDHGRIGRTTADLALADVAARLGAGLDPLNVDQLQGRIEVRDQGTAADGTLEVELKQLALTGPSSLPPTNAKLRLVRAGSAVIGGQFETDDLALENLGALAAHLPLPASWREQVRQLDARGQLAQLRYRWDGPAAAPRDYALQTRFERASIRGAEAQPTHTAAGLSRPGRPGFRNLSGTLSLDTTGGTVQVRATQAALELPGIYRQPLALATLNASAEWKIGDQFELKVTSFDGASADAQLRGQALYRSGGKGVGIIDASGQIARAEAAQVYKYMPLQIPPSVRDWLRTALVAGAARNGTFTLKGDLEDFPFGAGNGTFRVDAKVAGATLDYLPSSPGEHGAVWPRITDIDADFVYDRTRIEVVAPKAKGGGLQLAEIRAVIDDLTGDPQLAVSGKGSGALADMLTVVNKSPVGGWLDGFLEQTSAPGPGSFELKLDIPIAHARDTRVQGTVALVNSDVSLRDALPTFTRVNGKVEFTEKALRIAGVTGNVAGAAVRADVSTRPDGRFEIAATAIASPQALRPFVGGPAAQELIRRAQGTARVAANIVVGSRDDLLVTTDLVGVSLDLPEPLRKAAAEALPLRVEIASRDAGDAIRVTAGRRLAVALDRAREADGSYRVARGSFGVGDAANPVAALASVGAGTRGLQGSVALERLDLDAWAPVLSALASGGGADLIDIGQLNAQVRELGMRGKSLNNVQVRGTHRAGGPWRADVTADQLAGTLSWQPQQERRPASAGVEASAAADAQLTAHLARLAVQEGSHREVVELLDELPRELPALDVVVDDFELAGRKFGRLDLQARNTAGGASWQMQRLNITNPDGAMNATGEWKRAPAGRQREMQLDFAIEFVDAGKLLERMGMPGMVSGGGGKLDGRIAWLGSPLSLDYPSLSGDLRLATTKGRFLKVDPGAARLLAVLSMQALPRVLSLDFSDVFSNGFAFDEIAGTATSSAGVLTTRDFRMIGPSASVMIDGSADLKQETQDLHVLVLPDVNAGSASLAYALLANPAIGLGTFVAQWILREPLSKAFAREYDVRGKWSDPQVGVHARPANAAVPTTP